jgi:hypothetical protein
LSAARVARTGADPAGWAADKLGRAMLRRTKVIELIERYLPWMPSDLVARYETEVPELGPLSRHRLALAAASAASRPCTSGRDARGRFATRLRVTCARATEREAARREAAALAPWVAAIEAAKEARRAEVAEKLAARMARRRAVKVVPAVSAGADRSSASVEEGMQPDAVMAGVGADGGDRDKAAEIGSAVTARAEVDRRDATAEDALHLDAVLVDLLPRAAGGRARGGPREGRPADRKAATNPSGGAAARNGRGLLAQPQRCLAP